MAVTVRPYQKKDRAYVEQICIATAGPGFAETPYRERAAVAAFCRYFITHCPETCFVAADGSDIPVGYILCAPSFADWCRYAPEQFLSGFPFGLLWSIGSMLGAVAYLKQYPAHLHINLLPTYQRQGLGGQLMQALEQELRQRNCSGVSLCVDKHNHGAIRFYESCGFRILGRHPGSVAYGKILNEARR